MSYIDATEVAKTELTGSAVDEERVTDRNVKVRTEERRQLIRLLCITDKYLNVVDTS